MASTSTKIGHGLAKVLGIKIEQHRQQDPVTRGESTYSVDSADTYVEEEPHTLDALRELIPTGHGIVQYFVDLFPFTKWILRYNLQWFIGDLIAGITIGAVVVPQSMAYARLAQLAPEYGLYTSFMGVVIYWFFATSKDITIGPVAVMSTIVGNVVIKVQAIDKNVQPFEVASALAIICGGIITFLGLVRWGKIVEFIPLTAICAFMTGSAISIICGQLANLFGISVKAYNTRGASYLVFINFWRYIKYSKLDAAVGLTALAMLYLIRYACVAAGRKYPNKGKLFFLLGCMRTAFVILLYTLISWLVNRNHRTSPKFAILGNVPRGFQHAQVPVMNPKIIGYFASEIPASVIVLLIEHIAIAKSFGRINNYTINPSQELVAIGVTNLLGPFLGAYPATGSFSRTAIKSKAGVRTPLAGVITGIVVLLAIYALTAVFFYIPNAPLAAVIIHAVGDLITPPNTVYQFYRVAPFDVVIFFAGVIVTVFTTIEIGVYVTICTSLAVLLIRYLYAHGTFVGKVKIHSVVGDHLVDDFGGARSTGDSKPYDEDLAVRNVFLPLDHNDGSNPSVAVQDPYPGVFIYRFSEGFNYPNANSYLDHLVHHVFAHTRRTNPNSWARPGDRPWNNPGPRAGRPEADVSHLPTLKAIILDLASVNNIDATSVQNLIDVRNQLDRYTAPEKVQWHFSGLKNRWTKRALAAAGFGYPTSSSEEFARWKPIFSVADIGGHSSAAATAERETNRHLRAARGNDIEQADNKAAGHYDNIKAVSSASSADDVKVYGKSKVLLQSLNRPFFHLDLTNALQSAIINIEEHQKRGVGTEEVDAEAQAYGHTVNKETN